MDFSGSFTGGESSSHADVSVTYDLRLKQLGNRLEGRLDMRVTGHMHNEFDDRSDYDVTGEVEGPKGVLRRSDGISYGIELFERGVRLIRGVGNGSDLELRRVSNR